MHFSLQDHGYQVRDCFWSEIRATLLDSNTSHTIAYMYVSLATMGAGKNVRLAFVTVP
eukprot:m.219726 g.219726  ORF g.219726 m.219726 type:complete len:58 (+) comp15585_c0_seq5:1520-1693(+)